MATPSNIPPPQGEADQTSGAGQPAATGPQDNRHTPSENTLKAYKADWAHYARWCRLGGHAPMPPSPELIGRYLKSLAEPHGVTPALSRSTIERRLAGLSWNFGQRGMALDRADPRLTTVLATVRQDQPAPPKQKLAIDADDIRAMVATLPRDLRGLRDRAILLLGHAAGLRRSEIVGLDAQRDSTPDGAGWVKLHEARAVVTLDNGTAWRDVTIERAPSDQACAVHALAQWLRFARIDAGPVFVATSRDGKRALKRRLNDKHVARLIKRTVRDAGLRSELSEQERLMLFSGQSLRSGASVRQEKMRPKRP